MTGTMTETVPVIPAAMAELMQLSSTVSMLADTIDLLFERTADVRADEPWDSMPSTGTSGASLFARELSALNDRIVNERSRILHLLTELEV